MDDYLKGKTITRRIFDYANNEFESLESIFHFGVIKNTYNFFTFDRIEGYLNYELADQSLASTRFQLNSI